MWVHECMYEIITVRRRMKVRATLWLCLNRANYSKINLLQGGKTSSLNYFAGISFRNSISLFENFQIFYSYYVLCRWMVDQCKAGCGNAQNAYPIKDWIKLLVVKEARFPDEVYFLRGFQWRIFVVSCETLKQCILWCRSLESGYFGFAVGLSRKLAAFSPPRVSSHESLLLFKCICSDDLHFVKN